MSLLLERRRQMFNDTPPPPIPLFADGVAGVTFDTNVSSSTTNSNLLIYEDGVVLSSKNTYSTATYPADGAMLLQAVSTTASTRSNKYQCAAFISPAIDISRYQSLSFKGAYNKNVASLNSLKMTSFGVCVVTNENRTIFTNGYAGSFAKLNTEESTIDGVTVNIGHSSETVDGAGIIVRGYQFSTTSDIPFEYILDISDLHGLFCVCPFVLGINYVLTSTLKVTEMILT